MKLKPQFVAIAVFLFAAANEVTASPADIEGFSFVKSLGGIEEYRLKTNGLTVLLRQDHSVPVVTFQVTYRVGSRNEVTGTTGATHMLEHLMFKGSEHFNKSLGNHIDEYLSTVGARFNATTWYDRTNYYATLGTEALEGYIAIEADRMRNLQLREEDRKSEMTVVRNEYERGQNNPDNALDEMVMATAYVAQPYHHPTIGWLSDIERVPIEKLRAFYDTYYWPDNATVTIIGDIEPARALRLVRTYYGSIPQSPHPIPAVYTIEPPQQGERRVILRRGGEVPSMMVAYKAPDAFSGDFPALRLLATILTRGENSRLQRALVDRSLASEIVAGIKAQHDPALFTIEADIVAGISHEQVEKILLAEIDRVKSEGITQEELNRAISQLRAIDAYHRDGSAQIASDLNEWIAAGDWTYYVKAASLLAGVTTKDIQRVAATYLVADQSTTGLFIPVNTK